MKCAVCGAYANRWIDYETAGGAKETVGPYCDECSESILATVRNRFDVPKDSIRCYHWDPDIELDLLTTAY